jgi:penicillin G amidase
MENAQQSGQFQRRQDWQASNTTCNKGCFRIQAVALLISVLTLAACGGGGGDDGATPPPPVTVDSTVTIKRDTYGVPHVYANTVRGLFYGFGYSVAQDRLFQMEMAKRSVLGTVAEVLGPTYVALDKSSRQSIDVASVSAQLAKLSQEQRDIFDGYAAGYNARVREVLAQRTQLLPKQFVDAGFDPQEWTGLDVAMIWVGTMANRYSNGNSEVSNLQLLNQLKAGKGDAIGAQMFDEVRWLEDRNSPTTVPRSGANGLGAISASTLLSRLSDRLQGAVQSTLAAFNPKPQREKDGRSHLAKLAPVSQDVIQALHAVDAARKGVAGPDERPVASNLWIVGPQKTTDGSTIMINGPQFGWVNPAYVYGIGLHGAGYDLTGNTPFAHPVVLFGTNGKISWGATAGPLDVNDTYQERLSPASQFMYLYGGVFRPMTKSTEVIKVKGAADDSIDIYATVHGRVTSFDVANNAAYTLKRSWEGFEVQSLIAWIESTKAQNWDEWLAQAKKVAITINWYYADSKGNIGYVSPGRLPIRPSTQDIRLPAVGDGSMEWQGIRPFSDNPQVLNPSQGYIANWNNQSGPGVLTDGGNYAAADRMNEIRLRIEAKTKLAPDELWAIVQGTSFADVNARYLVPFIVGATQTLAATDPLYQAGQTLKNWDMLNRSTTNNGFYDGPAVTIFRNWLPNMYARVLQDDVPAAAYSRLNSTGYPGATPTGSTNVGTGTKLIYNALLGSFAGVPQTIDFFNGQDKNVVIRNALSDTLAQLTTRFGADQSTWLTAAPRHVFLPTNFIGYPQAGTDETLTLPTFMNRGTENDWVTFGGDGSVKLCTVAPPGQSGFISQAGVKSKHYDDQLSVYQNFGCKSEWLTPALLDANLESTVTLTP